jgi:hypothetical protein
MYAAELYLIARQTKKVSENRLGALAMLIAKLHAVFGVKMSTIHVFTRFDSSDMRSLYKVW